MANTKWCKKVKNDWNPGKWVLIWEYSARAFLWVPTWQGLDDFQISVCPDALDKSSLCIGRVKKILNLGYFMQAVPVLYQAINLVQDYRSDPINTLFTGT